jgi:hypothetical protein
MRTTNIKIVIITRKIANNCNQKKEGWRPQRLRSRPQPKGSLTITTKKEEKEDDNQDHDHDQEDCQQL